MGDPVGWSGALVRMVTHRTLGPWSGVTSRQLFPIQPSPARCAASFWEKMPLICSLSVRFEAGIFKSNVLNCGLLPVQVSDEFLTAIFNTVEADPKAQFEVDLISQTITNINAGVSVKFDINSYKKECMLNGYDDIDFLISLNEEIVAFEKA